MELKNISQAELDEKLKQHHVWLKSDGIKGHKVDLSYTNLSGMDLHGSNLRNANLYGANLRYANLQNANLRHADLEGADLQNANLQDADLYGADLSGTDLSGDDLSGANLWRADLHGADLSGANLWRANLHGADLSGTRLNWANWHGVDGIKVYVAGLQSSRDNAQLTYIPSIDVATTGCWQGTWQATIDRIHSVYEVNTRERKAYDLAIEYIKAQMKLYDVKI